MASLSEIYIKAEVLDLILKTVRKKELKGVGITINISDKSNAYGSNVSAHISQSKEDREAKKEKFLVGFGRKIYSLPTLPTLPMSYIKEIILLFPSST